MHFCGFWVHIFSTCSLAWIIVKFAIRGCFTRCSRFLCNCAIVRSMNSHIQWYECITGRKCFIVNLCNYAIHEFSFSVIVRFLWICAYHIVTSYCHFVISCAILRRTESSCSCMHQTPSGVSQPLKIDPQRVAPVSFYRSLASLFHRTTQSNRVGIIRLRHLWGAMLLIFSK